MNGPSFLSIQNRVQTIQNIQSIQGGVRCFPRIEQHNKLRTSGSPALFVPNKNCEAFALSHSHSHSARLRRLFTKTKKKSRMMHPRKWCKHHRSNVVLSKDDLPWQPFIIIGLIIIPSFYCSICFQKIHKTSLNHFLTVCGMAIVNRYIMIRLHYK